MPKPLHLIVACSENRVIGRGGRLPWKIPEDARFFEAQTLGKVVVLGRICFESWPRAIAAERRPVVVTRNVSLGNETVRVAPTFGAALKIAEDLPGEIYVCGGQRIYEEALALASQEKRTVRLHLTLVHAQVEGDRFFPEWRTLDWRELSRRESGDVNFRYTFFELER